MEKCLRVAQICTNASFGSVGSIVRDLCIGGEKARIEYLICYGRGNKPEGYNSYCFNNKLDIYSHAAMARLTDSDGLHSKQATKRLINRLIEFDPDIVHIHCLHGYYINYPLLIDFLNNNNIKVVWTMHDCWAFTGHCTHYTLLKCSKWKTTCENCPNKLSYPKSYFSNSKANLIKKITEFNSIKKLFIVTPSTWLKNEITRSKLKNKQVFVINNGIDTKIFKHTESNLIEQYQLINKKIVLGVSSVWDRRKGLDVFIELSKAIDNNYKIVLIGVDEKTKKKLPSNILAIKRTSSPKELAMWYSIAHVFLNPTLEDTYPTVNLEAIACHAPVLTCDCGGSRESAFAKDDNIIKENDINDIKHKISNVSVPLIKNLEFIDKERMINEYIKLYYLILKS